MSIFDNRYFEDFFLLYFVFLQPGINNKLVLLLSSVLIVTSQNIINRTSKDYLLERIEFYSDTFQVNV